MFVILLSHSESIIEQYFYSVFHNNDDDQTTVLEIVLSHTWFSSLVMAFIKPVMPSLKRKNLTECKPPPIIFESI